jgi:glycosyltransferase involved in cell wall biosynthesis
LANNRKKDNEEGLGCTKQSMKILHIWKTDYLGGGGGGIAMQRLHSGLRKEGVDSRILCVHKSTESSLVTLIPRRPRIEAWLKKISSRMGLNDIHCISSFRVKNLPEYQNTDIIHFHGIHSGFFSYLALPKLTKNKPGVFTLHDMWPMTGHCAVNYDCERWQTGCGHCPYPEAYPPIKRDGTRMEWKLKSWAYQRSNFVVISPSTAYSERAKLSLLQHFPIHRIPHGIDLDVFQPLDSRQCRLLLGIPPQKKVLMFGALALSQYNKGGDLLLKALQELPARVKTEVVLLLFGGKGEKIAEAAGLSVFNLGFVTNDRLKAIAYSAADLFISPTRVESFGLVCLEAMACGTPVVSYNIGGVPDIVRHGINGYLAEPENAMDLRDGLIKLLDDSRLRYNMGRQGPLIAKNEYALQDQVKKHLQLYRQILKKQSGRNHELNL